MKKALIQPRYRLRVKQRLAIVEYAVTWGIKPASRRFGLERKTIRRWRDRWRAEGTAGLVPRYPEQRPSRLAAEIVKLIEHARRELQYGAPRARVWLRRVHKRNVSLATIQRTFRRLGLPRLPGRSKRHLRPCHFPKAFPQGFSKPFLHPEGRRLFSAYGIVSTLSKSFSG